MLRKLEINNIALVSQAILEFGHGLTILTGETGAGKSIIVTALSLVLGERADQEYIRHGSRSARVIADFDDLQIFREIARDGTGKLKIDDSRATLSQLKELTSSSAQILGQHAGQELMDEEKHLDFLDTFAVLLPARETVFELFNKWRITADELRRITSKREQLIRERELLLFQRDEIERASIRIGEEEELLTERKLLDAAQNLITSASTISDILESENGVADMLNQARKELDQMAAVDQSLEKKVEELTEIDFQIEELRRFMEQYGSSIQDDPVRQEEVNLRLDEIYRLKKKYGGSEESILAALDRISNQLKERPNIDGLIESLSKEEERHRLAYSKKALQLSQARRKAAIELSKQAITELKDLAIDGAKFECELLYEDDETGVVVDNRAVQPFPYGLEKARFLFSANPGEPLKSLVKTASGGEMSRVLLALKSAELANKKEDNKISNATQPLLVFDEVDVGIGGRTAVEVGKKLKKLSESCQVLVITHLHQIARLADHHFVAEKKSEGSDRTVISVRKLEKRDIKTELERMVALPEGG